MKSMQQHSGRHLRTLVVVFFVTISLTKNVQTLPDGNVAILLDNVYNVLGKTKNNRCCSGDLDTTTGTCSRQCQMFVQFCISPGEGYPHSCKMGTKKTKIFHANSVKFPMAIGDNITKHGNRDLIQNMIPLEEFNNVFHFPIKETTRDEKLFKVVTKVYHVPLDQGPEVQISEHIALVSFSPHKIWTTFEAKQHYGPQVVYHIQTNCNENWGGSSCGYYCKPDNGLVLGHYNCSSDYKRICHYGWSGEFCNEPVCEEPCEHGICAGPNECLCYHGWKGRRCEICRTDRACVHGTCTTPFQCDCEPDWIGESCDLERYPCRNNPCKNNATCSPKQDWINGGVYCDCLPGYEGEFCETRTRPCASNPCLLGGTCIEIDDNNFKCICAFGVTGATCDTDYIDHCSPYPCGIHSEFCLDYNDRYECECKKGWSGINCTDYDSCSSNPCENAHRCDNIGSDYYCSCIHGWSGKNCNKNRNDCQGQCQNNATCVDELNEYKCICPPGYSGKNCEIDVNECSKAPCKNRGICIDGINNFSCVCQTGFVGDDCSQTVDFCGSHPCLHGATCITQHNDYRCICTKEYTGRNCEALADSTSDVPTCKESFCQHGSTCVIDYSKKEKCVCTHGYTGRFCEKDIDDCADNPCQNSGSCIDRVGSFQCVCPNGFTGSHCQTNINECEQNPCQNGGVCKDEVNSYSCKCQKGYRGHDCTHNINECIGVTCQNGGTCIDGINEYTCKCRTGFTGRHCDIEGLNWCYNQPCLHGTCHEKDNGYNCECKPGFTGSNCSIEINECSGVDCGNGQCIDQENGYWCQCDNEHYGTHCKYVESCSKQPCFNNATCENSQNDYICQCPSGFTGKDCNQVEDSCMMAILNITTRTSVVVPKGLCGMHGTCVSTSSTQFQCRCHPGWTGDRCHIAVDACINNLCHKDATCVNEDNGYRCLCPSGFTGRYCHVNIQECDDNPCENNGTCIDQDNDFVCSCKGEWKGKTCSSNTSHCDPSTCNHNGECIELRNTFQCQCKDGYKGPTCSITVNRCKKESCLNGGTCVVTSNKAFTCYCKPGYTGSRCEQDIDNCASNPCLNGGLCIDGVNRFDCACPKGFTGVDCAHDVNECASNPCPNGIECIDLIGAYKCKCPRDKRGLHCDVDNTEAFCQHKDRSFDHGESWYDECNKCLCNNGEVSCTKVVCGPPNCYKNRYLNCSCRQKRNTDCLTPPCREWGECGVFVTAPMSSGGCEPVNSARLSANCALMKIHFEKVKLPTGILLEEICEEFRYSKALQQHSNQTKIALSCRRYSFDENMNEILVSVNVNDTQATELAVNLANYFQNEVNGGSVLHALNKSTIKVTVTKFAVTREKESETSLIVSIVGGVVALAILVLFVTIVYSCVRKRKEDQPMNEIFFTKKKNVLHSEGTDYVKDFNFKSSNNSSASKVTNCDVRSEHFAPDKLYISEPKQFYV